MKKAIGIIITLMTLLLLGCSQAGSSLSASIPKGNVMIEKNKTIGAELCFIEDYEPFVLDHPQAIETFIDEINHWQFVSASVTLDLCGYSYVATFDDETLYLIASIEFGLFFYHNDHSTLYKLTRGNFYFFDDLFFGREIE